MDLNTPVDQIPLIGPRYRRLLQKLDIRSVGNLLWHIPHRYQDYALFSPISQAQPGETLTVRGQIIDIRNVYTRHGKKIQKAVVSDGEDKIETIWFNQPFLIKNLPKGTFVSLSGKVTVYGSRRNLVNPEYEKINHERRLETTNIHTGRLVPIYPETENLSSKWLRSRIAAILPQVDPPDLLPKAISKKYDLMDFSSAIKKVHFPDTLEQAAQARRRLAFQELLEYTLHSLLRKQAWHQKKRATPLKISKNEILKFIRSLPFTLTPSQKRTINEILSDMSRNIPMNRLLEGEVGSGKTVVAAMACYLAALNGYQSAVMTPTQILAQQHYKTLQATLKPLDIKVGLRLNQKSGIHNPLDQEVIVGTHSLIQENVQFQKLGLVVIDEQHRFGVVQRAKLWVKDKNNTPHMLTMTATPIPRTIALCLYGDLDLSTLDEMPKGRIPVKTWVVPPPKREAAYEWIRNRVEKTEEQAFIICPLIEESEAETMKNVRAATSEFKRLKQDVFPGLRMRLLHGRVAPDEKQTIMEEARQGKVDILVSTPVVEVGIDIPNATIMMIEGAERFGLAQLHQLRGRVGRGNKQSYCLLFSDSSSPQVMRRLRALERTNSGRELAQMDLQIRGPGEVYGTRQHGFPEFKVANLADAKLISEAREAAEYLARNMEKFPKFAKSIRLASIAPN